MNKRKTKQGRKILKYSPGLGRDGVNFLYNSFYAAVFVC